MKPIDFAKQPKPGIPGKYDSNAPAYPDSRLKTLRNRKKGEDYQIFHQ